MVGFHCDVIRFDASRPVEGAVTMVIVIVANGLEPQRERHEQGLTHQRTAPVSASVKSSSIRLKVALTALLARFVSIGVFDLTNPIPGRLQRSPQMRSSTVA